VDAVSHVRRNRKQRGPVRQLFPTPKSVKFQTAAGRISVKSDKIVIAIAVDREMVLVFGWRRHHTLYGLDVGFSFGDGQRSPWKKVSSFGIYPLE